MAPIQPLSTQPMALPRTPVEHGPCVRGRVGVQPEQRPVVAAGSVVWGGPGDGHCVWARSLYEPMYPSMYSYPYMYPYISLSAVSAVFYVFERAPTPGA
jgi:hypothetical protein